MKELSHGFILDKYVVISENDIEDVKSSNGVYKNNFHVGKRIKDFNQLEKRRLCCTYFSWDWYLSRDNDFNCSRSSKKIF